MPLDMTPGYGSGPLWHMWNRFTKAARFTFEKAVPGAFPDVVGQKFVGCLHAYVLSKPDSRVTLPWDGNDAEIAEFNKGKASAIIRKMAEATEFAEGFKAATFEAYGNGSFDVVEVLDLHVAMTVVTRQLRGYLLNAALNHMYATMLQLPPHVAYQANQNNPFWSRISKYR